MAFFSSQLRTAKFNSVSFEVTASSIQFGRRNQIHEYPQRDECYVEDLGRAKRQFTVTGFLIGDDYIAQTKRFIKALESDSPGKLIHPWLGTLDVAVIDTPKVTWSYALGYSSVEVTFVEKPKEAKATVSTSWGDKLRAEADNLCEGAANAFGLSFDNIDDNITLVTEIANGTYQDILGCLGDSKFAQLFQLGDSVSNLADTAVATFTQGSTAITDSFMSALGIAQFTSKLRNYRDSVKSLIDVVKDKTFLKGASDSASSSSTTTTATTASEAVTTYARQAMISNMVGAVSMIGTGSDSDDGENSTSVTQSASEILDIRDSVLSVLEQEMIYAQDDSADVYENLEALYSAVYQYLTNDVLQDVDLVGYTVKETTPALVLAYDLYEDASRVDEIVKRNGVVNPLFVPPSTLLVLDK